MKKYLLIIITVLLVFCGHALGDDVYWKTATVDANATWTDPIPVYIGGRVNIRIHPDTSPVMTIHAQCRYRGETTWYDVDYWDLTAASVDIVDTTAQPEPEPVQWRLGCKAGDYTSGNATIRIGTGSLR
jgi:ABC-type amino acid transport substrate-binding protein